MFRGEPGTTLTFTLFISISITALLMYSLTHNPAYLLLEGIITVVLLTKAGKLSPVASRATFSLISVASFLTTKSIAASTIFLFSAVFLLHNPIFIMLNPHPLKVVVRRIAGTIFLLAFVMSGGEMTAALCFMVLCALLVLMDFILLRKSAKSS